MILQNKEITETDICIIGSGIAGSTLAKKLAENNIDFIVIEAGSFSQDNNKKVNIVSDNLGRKFGLSSTRSISVGGTSNLWHGVLAPMDSIDFKKRSYIPQSGWPIDLKDLNKFYLQASKMLNLNTFKYFNLQYLPIKIINKFPNIFFNKTYLVNKIFQQPFPIKRFKSDLYDLLKKSSKFHIYPNTVALQLVNYENNKYRSLKVGKADGSTFLIKAKKFIIASGALESPRLLLNSKINNRNIGNFLMDHPMANVCQVRSNKKIKTQFYSPIKINSQLSIKTGLRLKDNVLEKFKLPNYLFYLRPSFTKGIDNETEKIKLSLITVRDGSLKFKDIYNIITNPKVILEIFMYKFSFNPKAKYFDLLFITEQTPYSKSRVKLSRTKDKWGYRISSIDWRLSQLDKQSMEKIYKLIKNKIYKLKDIYFVEDFDPKKWSSNFTSAAHHLGTARMGTSKHNSVVNKNLKVFNIDNLYVCDGSVFPTSGNANSSLTICALACRLIDHILTLKK